MHARKIFPLALIICGTFLFSCDMQEKQGGLPEPDDDNGGLVLPDGFSALVVADNLGRGRHIAVSSNGDIYMALRSLHEGSGIVALSDTNDDGRSDVAAYFGEHAGTGMQIWNGYLYFGSDTFVSRYRMEPGSLVPAEPDEIVAGGFPVQNQHTDKSFAINDKGEIYVNVGAPSNACMEQTRTQGSPGMDPCPQLESHAGIWRFDADRTGQRQMQDGYRYITGTRNAIALTWNEQVGELYIVMHGRDQLYQFFPEIYSKEDGAELPAEEFLLATEGSNFGWPYCYYDQRKKKLVLAPEYGGDGEITGRCEECSDPIMGFPGHLAPNDLLFYTGNQFPEKYRNGAFICFHGSWNRAPLEQKGYFVAFVPFKGSLPSGDWEVFADNFQVVETVRSPNDAVYRPMGLAQGPDGSIFVSDSQKGRIWRIMYTGN